MAVSKRADRHIQAKNYTSIPGGRAPIELIVMHVMQSGESGDTAEAVSQWAAGPNAPQASWHYAVDNNSTVSCVDERDVAWHAPGANHNGIGIEQAGMTGQNAHQWHDTYSEDMIIKQAAPLVADICRRLGIPCKRLTNAQLRAGSLGIVDHLQVCQVFKRCDHTDVGPEYPWGLLIAHAKKLLDAPKARYRYVMMDGEGKVIHRSKSFLRGSRYGQFEAFSKAAKKKTVDELFDDTDARIRLRRA